MISIRLIKLLIYILVVFVFLIIYGHALGTYFFQDDWFSLRISQAQTLPEMANFFIPRNDLIYYRPLGMQVPFFIFSNLMGFTPIPFKIVTVAFIFGSAYVVHLLIKRISGSKTLSYICLFLYTTSSIHFITISWSATIAFAMAAFFYFLSFYLYVDHKVKLSFLTLLIGLLTNEFLVTICLVITLWDMLEIRKIKISLVPFWVVSIFYFILRIKIITVPTSGDYVFAGNFREVLVNIRHFILWTFNWPDEIQNQFVSFFKLNPLFVKDFLPLTLFCIILMLFYIIAVFFSMVFQRSQSAKNKPLVLFGMIWFFLTLFPVLFFSRHSFSYYVQIPIFGILLIFAVVCKSLLLEHKKQTVLFLYLFSVIWIYSAIITVSVNKDIHWVPRRALLSKRIVTQLSINSSISETNIIIIPQAKGSEEYKWALGDQNAVQYLYKNPRIITFYGSYAEYLNSEHADLKLSPIVINL